MKAPAIALLSYDYPPNDGGISRLVASAAAEMARRGVDTEVLTLARSGVPGVERADVPTREVRRSGLRRDLATWAYARRLPSACKVLASVWNPEGTMALLAGHRNYYLMAHGNEVMRYPDGPRGAMKALLRKHVLSNARGVICNSRYTEGLVRDLAPQVCTHVICPAVDADRFALLETTRAAARSRFGLPQDKRIALSVSRLNAYKGHDVVLRAIAGLPTHVRDHLHYVVAGRGDHLAALQRLAQDLGIAAIITWSGFVRDEDLPALYRAADLFVLCTREDPLARGVEGFGMVFLEAQAAGVPVLGTRSGGIPDAIAEGEGGWLVPQDSSEAVAAHLVRLAEAPEAFAREGAVGRARALRDASWSVYVDKLLRSMDIETP